MTLDEKYVLEWKSAKKQIRKRHLKKALLSFVTFLVLATFSYICFKVDSDARWCSDGGIIALLFAIVFFLGTFKVLFSNTSSENAMLGQINQAYQNAKMMQSDDVQNSDTELFK